MYIYMLYIYICIYICIYMYIYVYICMYIYMYIYMYIWVNYSISLTLKKHVYIYIYVYVLYIHICMILLFYSFFPFYLQYIAIKKQYFQNISRSQYSHRLPMNFPPFQRRAPPGNPVKRGREEFDRRILRQPSDGSCCFGRSIQMDFPPPNMSTPWLFNIAMENGPSIDGLPIKNGDFPW